MNAITRTRFFAQNYPLLQGLRTIPVGICLLVITVWANGQDGPASDLTLPLMVSLGCVVLYILIDQYYNRTYGRVKRNITPGEIFLQVSSGLLALAAFVVDTSNLISISLIGLVFAATFALTGFLYWQPIKTLFMINLLLASAFAVLSVLPLTGVQEWWTLFGLKHSLLAFTILFGGFSVLAGIMSHIYFVRLLPSPQDAS